jgi:hypothetical protein
MLSRFRSYKQQTSFRQASSAHSGAAYASAPWSVEWWNCDCEGKPSGKWTFESTNKQRESQSVRVHAMKIDLYGRPVVQFYSLLTLALYWDAKLHARLNLDWRDVLNSRMGGSRYGRRLWDSPSFLRRHEQVIFLFSETSTAALGSTQAPSQWVPGFFRGVQICRGVLLISRLPSSAEAKPALDRLDRTETQSSPALEGDLRISNF